MIRRPFLMAKCQSNLRGTLYVAALLTALAGCQAEDDDNRHDVPSTQVATETDPEIAEVLETLGEVDTQQLPDETLNGVMMQYFHWYSSGDGQHWNQVAENAQDLADKGITALWLPPAYKGSGGGYDVGYAVYDLYDLGEFNAKGSVRTKYGTKDQYLNAINKAHDAGISIYADIVLNHMIGADGTANVPARVVDKYNRNRIVSDVFEVEAYTEFTFPSRKGKYSDFTWKWYHFDGVDYNNKNGQGDTVYLFATEGKAWDQGVSSENGNYDYLMGADVDFDHPEVVDQLKKWGNWYTEFANLDGFRIDAVKHIKSGFYNEWLYDLRAKSGKNLFAVAEYWDYDVKKLLRYLDDHNNNDNNNMSLFDAPLHKNFHDASRGGGFYDMGSILNNTLTKYYPIRAVTLVENHDTQPLQMLESPVEDWFKPLAYGIILLQEAGYPNVFHADYYGATYRDKGRDGNEYTINLKSHKDVIDQLLAARRDYAYGAQHSYYDHWDIIGFTREGNASHPGGLAMILSDGPGGEKRMYVGPQHAGKCFKDALKKFDHCVTIDSSGHGVFQTRGGDISVWVGE